MIFPSIKHAISSAKWAILALFHRKPLIVSAEAVEKRLAICQKCPQFVPDGRQCTVCTCFVDLKAQLSTEDCPEHRWP